MQSRLQNSGDLFAAKGFNALLPHKIVVARKSLGLAQVFSNRQIDLGKIGANWKRRIVAACRSFANVDCLKES